MHTLKRNKKYQLNYQSVCHMTRTPLVSDQSGPAIPPLPDQSGGTAYPSLTNGSRASGSARQTDRDGTATYRRHGEGRGARTYKPPRPLPLLSTAPPPFQFRPPPQRRRRIRGNGAPTHASDSQWSEAKHRIITGPLTFLPPPLHTTPPSPSHTYYLKGVGDRERERG